MLDNGQNECRSVNRGMETNPMRYIAGNLAASSAVQDATQRRVMLNMYRLKQAERQVTLIRKNIAAWRATLEARPRGPNP